MDLRLKDQEIQIWLTGVEKSDTLRFYKQIKVVYREELYLRLNLPWRALKCWLQVRENCVLLRSGYWNSYDADGREVSVLAPLVGSMGITWKILGVIAKVWKI
jgi:hypothetical protein